MAALKPIESSDVYVLITADPVPVQSSTTPLPSLAVPEALKAAHAPSSIRVLLPIVHNPVVSRSSSSSQDNELVDEWRSNCRMVCGCVAVLYIASFLLWPTLLLPIAGAAVGVVGYVTTTLHASQTSKRVHIALLLLQLWLNICMMITDIWAVVSTVMNRVFSAETCFLVVVVLAILFLHQRTNTLFRHLRRHTMESSSLHRSLRRHEYNYV